MNTEIAQHWWWGGLSPGARLHTVYLSSGQILHSTNDSSGSKYWIDGREVEEDEFLNARRTK
jgi:hypothetical protein